MGEAARPAESEFIARIRALERRVEALERVPSGRQSIGILHLRPSVKAGTPADGDFPNNTPPIGAVVIDTSANRIWVRTAAATWRWVALT